MRMRVKLQKSLWRLEIFKSSVSLRPQEKKLKVHYTMKSFVCITKSNTLIRKLGVCVKMNSRTFLPDLHLIPKNAYPGKIRMLAGSVFLEQRKLLFFSLKTLILFMVSFRVSYVLENHQHGK